MIINHPVFGRVTFADIDDIGEYGDICDLAPIMFNGVSIPADLFYSLANLSTVTSRDLDVMAQLAGRIIALDVAARGGVSDAMRKEWLSDRADITIWSDHVQVEAQAHLTRAFPNVQSLLDVTHADFIAALRLVRAGFSLDLGGSGGATLTLDYRILPLELDGGVFAAKFAADGSLIEVVTES